MVMDAMAATARVVEIAIYEMPPAGAPPLVVVTPFVRRCVPCASLIPFQQLALAQGYGQMATN